MSKSVLIVDDELDIQSSLSFALKDEGYEVITATLPAEAEVILAKREIDLALFDVWFPQGDGIELLTKVHDLYPKTTVIMMSGHGNIELALKAIRFGAYDFLEKPLELEKVLVVLRNAAEAQSLRLENQRLALELGDGPDEPSGTSANQFTGKLYEYLKSSPLLEEFTLRELRAQFEKSVIESRLQANAGNIARAADSLGIERVHLYRKIKQLGIETNT